MGEKSVNHRKSLSWVWIKNIQIKAMKMGESKLVERERLLEDESNQVALK